MEVLERVRVTQQLSAFQRVAISILVFLQPHNNANSVTTVSDMYSMAEVSIHCGSTCTQGEVGYNQLTKELFTES